jgi:hypothetical protein
VVAGFVRAGKRGAAIEIKDNLEKVLIISIDVQVKGHLATMVAPQTS